MKPSPEWVSAAAAARMLGVARATLYAYVSRGLVRSRPIAGTRRREYHASDLRRLVARRDARSGHGAVAAGALRWGEPVLDSSITEIRADGPHYRGASAVALAQSGATFESVAERLWDAREVDWSARAPTGPVLRLSRALPRGARPLDAMTLVTAALAAADPLRDVRDVAVWRQAVTSVRGLALGIAIACDPARLRAVDAQPSVARAALVAWGRRPSSASVAAIESALVLMADHELNPSTFAARVAGSVGADLHACIGAALATVSGPDHGGMTERVAALVHEIDRPERAAALVHARLRRGDPMPGFGHPLYPGGDPRAPPLLAVAAALAPRRVATIVALVHAMALAGAEPPTVDLGLCAVASALGLPAGAATALFALGRSAGWIAHALEQRAAGFALRPRARYRPPSP